MSFHKGANVQFFAWPHLLYWNFRAVQARERCGLNFYTNLWRVHYWYINPWSAWNDRTQILWTKRFTFIMRKVKRTTHISEWTTQSMSHILKHVTHSSTSYNYREIASDSLIKTSSPLKRVVFFLIMTHLCWYGKSPTKSLDFSWMVDRWCRYVGCTALVYKLFIFYFLIIFKQCSMHSYTQEAPLLYFF